MKAQSQDTKVDEIIGCWNRDKSNLIEMLQDVQDHFRYVPSHVAEKLSDELDVPMSRIFHITTFYKGFTLEPRGKHPICVCTGTACHVKGGTRVLENVLRELDVEEGKITDDLLFSVESVRCLGCCALAPAVTIGKDIYGQVKSSSIPRILKKYRTASD